MIPDLVVCVCEASVEVLVEMSLLGSVFLRREGWPLSFLVGIMELIRKRKNVRLLWVLPMASIYYTVKI